MPSRINEGRFSQPLAEEFGVLGGISLQLDETIVPIVIVEDVRERIWTPAGGGSSSAPAGAGNFRNFSLTNPAGSGVLVRVRHVNVNSNVAWRMSVNRPALVGPTAIATQFFDARVAQFPISRFPSVAFVDLVELATVGVPLLRYIIGNSMPLDLLQGFPYILRPGSALFFGQELANQPVNINAFWDERPLLPRES